MKVLTVEQTRDLLNRGILDINNTHINIHNCPDDFVIDKVYDLGTNIRFVASRLKYEEPRNIGYNEISAIGGMKIDDIISAYMFDDEDMIEIDIKTDVVNDVFGKSEAIIDNHKLSEGMKIILHNDKTKKYNGRTLTVKYTEEDGFKLVGQRGRPKKSS